MKNLRLVIAMIALLASPFFAKAQIIILGPPALTVNYVDHGYGSLTCVLTTSGLPHHTYSSVIVNGSNHTFTTNDQAWSQLTLSTAPVDVPPINVSDLEGQAIGVDVGYSYVASTNGPAPQFTIKRNSAYNYTVTSWLTPL